MGGFHQVLTGDFAGHEDLRQRIINRVPRFGNNEPQTNALVCEVTGMIRRSCEGIVTPIGSKAVPGACSYPTCRGATRGAA